MHVTSIYGPKEERPYVTSLYPKQDRRFDFVDFLRLSNCPTVFLFLFLLPTHCYSLLSNSLSFFHPSLSYSLHTNPIPISFFPNTSFIVKSPTISLFIFDFVACLRLFNYSSSTFNSRSFLHPNSSYQASYCPVQYGHRNRTRIMYA